GPLWPEIDLPLADDDDTLAGIKDDSGIAPLVESTPMLGGVEVDLMPAALLPQVHRPELAELQTDLAEVGGMSLDRVGADSANHREFRSMDDVFLAEAQQFRRDALGDLLDDADGTVSDLLIATARRLLQEWEGKVSHLNQVLAGAVAFLVDVAG